MDLHCMPQDEWQPFIATQLWDPVVVTSWYTVFSNWTFLHLPLFLLRDWFSSLFSALTELSSSLLPTKHTTLRAVSILSLENSNQVIPQQSPLLRPQMNSTHSLVASGLISKDLFFPSHRADLLSIFHSLASGRIYCLIRYILYLTLRLPEACFPAPSLSLSSLCWLTSLWSGLTWLPSACISPRARNPHNTTVTSKLLVLVIGLEPRQEMETSGSLSDILFLGLHPSPYCPCYQHFGPLLVWLCYNLPHHPTL